MDFKSGVSSGSSVNKQNLVWIHCVLMLMGWGVALPLGILMAIFKSRVDVAKGQGKWLAYHRNLQ